MSFNQYPNQNNRIPQNQQLGPPGNTQYTQPINNNAQANTQMNSIDGQFGQMSLNEQSAMGRGTYKLRSKHVYDPSVSQMPSSPTAQSQQEALQQGFPQPLSNPQHQFMGQGNVEQKPKIDPSQMPSVVDVRNTDQDVFVQKTHNTLSKEMLPLSTTQFTAYDEGNCNPKFMRFTINNVPTSKDLMEAMEIPFGAVIQPFAKLAETEYLVPTVETENSPGGIVRCTRCKAYINPFFKFMNGGSVFICNLCSFENETSQEFYSALDVNGYRLDHSTRPELMYGSYEFNATKEYCLREPKPPAYIFVIDVSSSSVQSGVLQNAVHAIKECLYTSLVIAPKVKIGILTFDKTIHFYNLHSNLEEAQMLVVGDVEHPFVPLYEGSLVDAHESRQIIEKLLDSLPTMFAKTKISDSAFFSAIESAKLAIEENGGKIIAFQSCMPNSGKGILKRRDTLKGTVEDEKKLFSCSDDLYTKLAKECVQFGVSVDLFVCSVTQLELSTISELTSLTGGELYYYQNHKNAIFQNLFAMNLYKNLTNEFAFDAVMRLRCSTGIVIDEHYGNFDRKTGLDLDLAGINCTSAISCTFKLEGKLDEYKDVYFQAAILYTNIQGVRKIRIHNYSLPVTNLIGSSFKQASIDTTTAILTKSIASSISTINTNSLREQLTEKCVRILAAYRKNCAQGTSPGQLILPEAFKLLPVLLLGILKLDMLRSNPNIPIDKRVCTVRLLNSMGLQQLMLMLYPIIIKLDSEECIQMNLNSIKATNRASYMFLEETSPYCLCNGYETFLWVGKQTPAKYIKDVFNADSFENIDTYNTELVPYENENSKRAIQMFDRLRNELMSRYSNITVIRQGLDSTEPLFSEKLIEDKVYGGQDMNYVDFLCYVHRQIQIELART